MYRLKEWAFLGFQGNISLAPIQPAISQIPPAAGEAMGTEPPAAAPGESSSVLLIAMPE